MLTAFAKGFAQLSDPRIRRLILLTVAIAIGVFVSLWIVVGLMLTETTLFSIGWLDTVVDVLGGAATLVVTLLLFPAVFSAVVGLFLDQVAAIVERQHYPGWPPARDSSLTENIIGSVKFLVTVIALNILVFLFLLVPPLFPFVFLLVNGYLLGREYFEVAALRHADPRTVRGVWRQNRLRLVTAGILIALMLSVPLLNLVIPVVGTAAMVHFWAKLAPRA